VLGMCFGFCLLVVKMEYSVALGAFMIGAIMAEARQLHLIERLIEPVRDMFSAIFFVAIGLLFDPRVLTTYAWPIAIITAAVVIGKVVACSLGTFVAGNEGRTSLRVGMGLAQIGEFSFIIATLGLTLKVTSDFLYPIVVAVSAITTLLTPYLIKLADPLSVSMARALPRPVAHMFNRYAGWLQSMQLEGDKAIVARIILRILLQILINCAMVAAVFLAGAYFMTAIERNLLEWIADEGVQRMIVWGGALIISLPFLVASYRKLDALGMLLAELAEKAMPSLRLIRSAIRFVTRLIPILSIIGILVLIAALSARILPPPMLLLAALATAAVLTALLWKFFVRLHTRLQLALFDAIEQEKDRRH